jgi:hypothetical protein
VRVRFESDYSAALLRNHPDEVFVFGDNLVAKGKGGQAIIRDEPNAFGVPTKRLPTRAADAYFSDHPDEIEAVVRALRELYKLGKSKTLVFPSAGIGTGLAKMKEKSPKAWGKMCAILEVHFGISNGVDADVTPAP